MSPFEIATPSLTARYFDPWFWAKGLFLAVFLFYFAYAVVVIRQVKLMSHTLQGVFGWPLRAIAWLQLILIVFVLFLSWRIL